MLFQSWLVSSDVVEPAVKQCAKTDKHIVSCLAHIALAPYGTVVAVTLCVLTSECMQAQTCCNTFMLTSKRVRIAANEQDCLTLAM